MPRLGPHHRVPLFLAFPQRLLLKPRRVTVLRWRGELKEMIQYDDDHDLVVLENLVKGTSLLEHQAGQKGATQLRKPAEAHLHRATAIAAKSNVMTAAMMIGVRIAARVGNLAAPLAQLRGGVRAPMARPWGRGHHCPWAGTRCETC